MFLRHLPRGYCWWLTGELQGGCLYLSPDGSSALLSLIRSDQFRSEQNTDCTLHSRGPVCETKTRPCVAVFLVSVVICRRTKICPKNKHAKTFRWTKLDLNRNWTALKWLQGDVAMIQKRYQQTGLSHVTSLLKLPNEPAVLMCKTETVNAV